ncbi:hypothetical protein FRC07_013671 [Ceratobasidium sp. 392]|nr:hypothetical protein FRC07_013671 [Ceratobasidium sp. 392]
MWGSSTNNQRIERLWLDVGKQFARIWRAFFICLEDCHQLDRSNTHHLWLLQVLFLGQINSSALEFQQHWNLHGVSGPTTHNQTPEDMRFLGQLEHGIQDDIYEDVPPEILQEYLGVDADNSQTAEGSGAGLAAEDHIQTLGEADDDHGGDDLDEMELEPAEREVLSGLQEQLQVEQATHRCPFEREEEILAFEELLAEALESEVIPHGYGVRPEEWENGVYPEEIYGTQLRLHVYQLCRTSRILRDMFLLVQSDADGSTPDKPVVLDNYGTKAEWVAYITHEYPTHHQSEPVVRNADYWYNLLTFGDKFEAPWAVRDAKEALDTMDVFPFTPVTHLALGRTYGFQDWISAAAAQVLQTPQLDFSEHDCALLGSRTMRLIDRMNFKLSRRRQKLVTLLPLRLAIHSTACPYPTQCGVSWRTVCDRIQLAFFSYPNPSTESSIADLVRNPQSGTETAPMLSMSLVCRERVRRLVLDDLKGEDISIVEDATAKIASLAY